MSVTSGFFTSTNGDRKYSAEQMSSIFDGIVNDGVYESIGNRFAVTPTTGLSFTVGTGRGWFDKVWILNDSVATFTLDSADVLLSRIDAVVIDVDKNAATRAATIKVIKGSPASSPSDPILIKEASHNQYPIAYINIAPNQSTLTSADVLYKVGSDECPYVTGILQTISISEHLIRWAEQWDSWFSAETTADSSEFNEFMSDKQAEFSAWYDTVKDILVDGSVAANLTARIADLEERIGNPSESFVLLSNVSDSSEDNILDSNGNNVLGSSVYQLL